MPLPLPSWFCWVLTFSIRCKMIKLCLMNRPVEPKFISVLFVISRCVKKNYGSFSSLAEKNLESTNMGSRRDQRKIFEAPRLLGSLPEDITRTMLTWHANSLCVKGIQKPRFNVGSPESDPVCQNHAHLKQAWKFTRLDGFLVIGMVVNGD